MLACVSSDGKVLVTSKAGDAAWSAAAELQDCMQGALAVTWAPHTHLGASLAGRSSVRLATAGCDERVRVWVRTDGGEWRLDDEGLLEGEHKRWVRDVAWAPATGLPVNQLASCSEDGKVVVWEQKRAGGRWEPSLVRDFGAPVWRISWSLTGGILAASSGDPTGEATVTLFKQTLLGEWAEIKAADAATAASASPEPAASAVASASASGAGIAASS
jgi:protein transport protein SEC13